MSIYDYSACIKITFDRPIVSDLEVVTGTEYLPLPELITDAMLTVSGYYDNRDKKYAADKDLATRWQTPTSGIPGWITTDFGADRCLALLRLYTISGQYPLSEFTLQGSNDNSSWADVTAGTISSSYTGWSDFAFAPATFRYWRVYVTAGTSSYATIYEMQFYAQRTKYRTEGWEVYAQESNRIPDGVASKTNYTIRKVTKSDDGMSVFLWLDLYGRIKYPLGNITVKFTGTMLGPNGAVVEPFELSFAPTQPAKIFNPNDVENLTASINATVSSFDVTYRYAQQGAESITAQASASVVATKVGELPL